MDLLLKHSLKLISYEFSTGILFSSLAEELKSALPHISFSEQDLLSRLLSNLEIYHLSIDPKSSPKDPKLISSKNLIDKFTKQDILGLFLSEDEDKKEVITNIYEIILKSRETGVSYTEINKKLKKKMNLDLEINMTSHYCRKLASCNLVEINSTKTCKNVICKIFTPSILKKTLVKKNNDNNDLPEKRDEMGGCFNFHELTFKQNVLANLMSAEANLKNGLSLIELGERIGKPKETKMLNRYLGKIQKAYDIKIKPERQGRLYSYKYLIENEEIKKKLKVLHEEVKEIDELDENGAKIEEDSGISKPNIHEIVQNELKKQETYVLNTQCFLDLIQIFMKNHEYSDFLKKVLDPELFINILAFKSLTNKEKEAKIIKNLNTSNIKDGKNKYELLTENMIKILIEKVEFDMIKKALTNTLNDPTNSKSKKQVSSLKINRYIFSLNEIYLNKILSIQALKQKIINLEFQAAIGKIDRKTILFMLESLETVGLIRLIYKDLGAFIKPKNESLKKEDSAVNNFFKQNKNIIILAGIKENDRRIDEIVQEYKNKKENDKVLSTKKEKLNENTKKIKKSNRKSSLFRTKEEFNVKFENLWNEDRLLKEENGGSRQKSIYSYTKLNASEMKKTILRKVLTKNAEKIKRRNIKFSWKRLRTNMEVLSLQEALKKVAMKEETRNNFLSFSMKFDAFNKTSIPSPDFHSNYSIKTHNLGGVLEEIDRNIENFESMMEIEDEKTRKNVDFTKELSENRRKHERNIEKIKYLLIKYPMRKMKDIETQLNNINYVDVIWKELHRNEMIKVLKIDEDGNLIESEEVNFAKREEYYYKVNEKFYEYF